MILRALIVALLAALAVAGWQWSARTGWQMRAAEAERELTIAHAEADALTQRLSLARAAHEITTRALVAERDRAAAHAAILREIEESADATPAADIVLRTLRRLCADNPGCDTDRATPD